MWVFVAHDDAFELVVFSFEFGVFFCEFYEFLALLAGLAGSRGFGSLGVEADYSYSFSYPVSGHYYAGAVCAGFGYFL